MQTASEIAARIVLKKGKERPVLQKHHWIFSGAIAKLDHAENGSIAKVYSHENMLLGSAMIGTGQSIVGHMIAFGEESVEVALRARISSAIQLRKSLFDTASTNAFRLINAEGDGLPGLIVDSYDGVLVLQCSHPALEHFKELLVSLLVELAVPRAIFEKSTSFLRKKEGMQEIKRHLYGEENPEVEVWENGLKYLVHVLEGQKTGLFLDQREMRFLVSRLAKGKKVLNCFAYTGGFSISALAAGAESVDSVEISKKCQPLLERNLDLNGLCRERHRFYAEDAIDYVIRSEMRYDLVILDPPAFVKRKQDIAQAFRAYKDLNRAAMMKMPSGSLLLTSSCSYHVGEELFQNILFRASLEAGRNVRILSDHIPAHDHPRSIFHPESSYLKSLLLYLE